MSIYREAFRTAFRETGLVRSLGGTGDCLDNAGMESFFATLKKEKIYRISAYKLMREQVKSIIFRYIFVYHEYDIFSLLNTASMGAQHGVKRKSAPCLL